MVRVLAVADEVCDALWGARAAALEPDLVLAAGDLPWDYLEFLASVTDRPVVFVPGNHDPQIERVRKGRNGAYTTDGLPCDGPRPRGATEDDVRVVTAAGLRIAGLGGCVRYKPGANQYTQREFDARARRLLRRAGRGGPVDVLLTHAPPLGLGDGADKPHEGIAALHKVLERLRPTWHVHGHIHPYGQRMPDRQVGPTTIRNVIPWRLVDIEPRSTHRPVPGSGTTVSGAASW